MKIDFHSNVADKLNYTCRLIRKAYNAGARLVVFDTDTSQLRQLDEALWTLTEAEFLPHVGMDHAYASLTPIIFSAGRLNDSPHFDLLINLSSSVPEHYQQFGRMIEIVSQEQAETLSGRERYRHYQQQGHSLSHYPAK